MPPREAAHRIRDIIDAIEKVERYAQADPDLKSEVQLEAVLYNLAVIGEAVKAIPQDVRDLEPDADWKPASKLRDFLVHRYFATDPLVIATTITDDLPKLKAAAERVLERLKNPKPEPGGL